MLPLRPAVRGRVLAHYEWVVDWINDSFQNAPLIATYYPHGLDGGAAYSGAWYQPLPATVPHVQVRTWSGVHVYPGCEPDTLIWLVQKGAVGLGSWTPTVKDVDAVRYGRLVLRQTPGADDVKLRTALKRLRIALQTFGLDGVPLLEGHGGALFVPFADAPGYDAVRTFLQGVVVRAAATAPDVIATERKAHEPVAVGRIEVTVRSNAPGQFSSLPYSLVGPHLAMVTPIEWDEIDRVRLGSDASATAVRLHKGDLFGQQAARLAKQRFAGGAAAH